VTLLTPGIFHFARGYDVLIPFREATPVSEMLANRAAAATPQLQLQGGSPRISIIPVDGDVTTVTA
jgi:hypothetical protein